MKNINITEVHTLMLYEKDSEFFVGVTTDENESYNICFTIEQIIELTEYLQKNLKK
jgi:hypothetical protein